MKTVILIALFSQAAVMLTNLFYIGIFYRDPFMGQREKRYSFLFAVSIVAIVFAIATLIVFNGMPLESLCMWSEAEKNRWLSLIEIVIEGTSAIIIVMLGINFFLSHDSYSVGGKILADVSIIIAGIMVLIRLGHLLVLPPLQFIYASCLAYAWYLTLQCLWAIVREVQHYRRLDFELADSREIARIASQNDIPCPASTIVQLCFIGIIFTITWVVSWEAWTLIMLGVYILIPVVLYCADRIRYAILDGLTRKYATNHNDQFFGTHN